MLSFWMRLISLATSDGLDLFLFLGCLSLLQLSSIIIMLWFWYPCLSFFHTVFVSLLLFSFLFFFFNQKTAYELRIRDWSSDVCSSDLANMQGANLEDASLQDSCLLRANLREACLDRAFIKACDLTGTDALLMQARAADFTDSRIVQASWRGAIDRKRVV